MGRRPCGPCGAPSELRSHYFHAGFLFPFVWLFRSSVLWPHDRGLPTNVSTPNHPNNLARFCYEQHMYFGEVQHISCWQVKHISSFPIAGLTLSGVAKLLQGSCMLGIEFVYQPLV